MLRKKLIFYFQAILLCLILDPVYAQTQELWYGGIDFDVYDIEIENESYNPRQLKVHAGRWFRQNMGAEIQLGTGVRDDTVDGFEVNTSFFQAAFVRFQSPVDYSARATLLLGLGRIQLDGDLNHSGFPGKEWFSGPIASLGLLFPIQSKQQLSAGFAYSRYFFEDELKMDGLSATLRLRF